MFIAGRCPSNLSRVQGTKAQGAREGQGRHRVSPRQAQEGPKGARDAREKPMEEPEGAQGRRVNHKTQLANDTIICLVIDVVIIFLLLSLIF